MAKRVMLKLHVPGKNPELIIHVEDMETEKAYIYYNVELVTSTVCRVMSMIEK